MPVSILRIFVLLAVLCLPIVVAAAGARAQEAPASATATASAAAAPVSVVEQVRDWLDTLDAVSDRLLDADTPPQTYQELRERVGGMAAEARVLAERARATTGIMRQMVTALGPPPGPGEDDEPESVARERARLDEQIRGLEAQAREADLVVARADFLLRSAADHRLDRFARDLFRVDPSPLAPTTWRALEPQATFLWARVGRPVFEAARAPDNFALARQFAVAAIVLVGAALLRRWLLARWDYRAVAAVPTARRRIVLATIQTVARGLLPAAATVAVAMMLAAWLGAAPSMSAPRATIHAIARGVIVYVLLAALVRAVLTPRDPSWRIADIADACARPLARHLRVAAAGVGLVVAMLAFLDAVPVPPETRAVSVAGALLVGGAALLLALPGHSWRRREAAAIVGGAPAAGAAPQGQAARPSAETKGDDLPETDATAAWPRLRAWVGLATIAVIVASALGYQNLAVHAVTLIGAASLVTAVLLAFRATLREAVAAFLTRPTGRIAKVRRHLLGGEKGLWAAELVAQLSIDALVLLIGVALLLPFAGLGLAEIGDIVRGILAGVRIGDIVISPIDILAAMIAFVIGLAVTRVVQKRLDSRLLERVQIDVGVRASIRTVIGYVGVLIAVIVAIGLLGLDLSQLALIAGALSVGIGFGLQNVVNNFVSGLIMLAERPVKVGDWVRVGGHEGTVQRISVRSTELRTFQRASVIIPNGDFISNAVVNLTHKDRMARIEIPVGIDYGADPERARDLLMRVARDDPRVAFFPPPVVVFKDFGASSLDLELRVFVDDTDHILGLSTDLRFAIWRAFRDGGIDIPFTQQVVHMPQLDDLIAALRARGVLPEAEGGAPGEGQAEDGAPGGPERPG